MNSPNHSAIPGWLQQARNQWTRTGESRPDFAKEPAPGQESVWDYPRPPTVVTDARLVEVRRGDIMIASTSKAVRVLETSHPPSFYVPASALAVGVLVPVPGSSHCEWKGQAEYVALSATDTPIGWRYLSPYPEFAAFAGYVSFYPDVVDCSVDSEAVRAQAGGFYGGWITNEIVGQFKGESGTTGW
jgi:uncharacterized protein (DUF427 family)